MVNKLNYKMTCNNETETTQLATKLGELLQAGDVVALEGDLGAGKTTFTKAVAKALGITRNVNSPTYTIMKQYQGRLPLYHFDVYRMEEADEDLGFDEFFYGEGVCIVEWAHLIEPQLPAEMLKIQIRYVGEISREITLEAVGTRYETICEGVMK